MDKMRPVPIYALLAICVFGVSRCLATPVENIGLIVAIGLPDGATVEFESKQITPVSRNLPPAGKVWRYRTPPLSPTEKSYKVSATWLENGIAVTHRGRVVMKAGSTATFDPRSLMVGDKGLRTMVDLYHHSFAHRWQADRDYEELARSWRPGSAHPTSPNLVADDRVGVWTEAPGYRPVGFTPDTGRIVAWTPGQRHPLLANVVAAKQEGFWQPKEGHCWAPIPDDVIRGAISCATNTEVRELAIKILGDSGVNPTAETIDYLGNGLMTMSSRVADNWDAGDGVEW